MSGIPFELEMFLIMHGFFEPGQTPAEQIAKERLIPVPAWKPTDENPEPPF